MKNLLAGVTVLAGLMAAGVTAADTINPLNQRQVTVGSSYDTATPCWGSAAANCELQTLVNFVNPGANINVNTDQQSAGMWSLDGALTVSVVLDFKVAGDAGATSMGLWSEGTNGVITTVDLFTTDSRGLEYQSATPAQLIFDPITGELAISGGWGVNTGTTFTGIDPNAFGFYLEDTNNGNLFYSVDSLNPGGLAQVLAFQNPNTASWTLGFEDTTYGKGDSDFQDAMIQVSPMTPVPEPGSLLLLGTGLAGLVGVIRRRMRS